MGWAQLSPVGERAPKNRIILRLFNIKVHSALVRDLGPPTHQACRLAVEPSIDPIAVCWRKCFAYDKSQRGLGRSEARGSAPHVPGGPEGSRWTVVRGNHNLASQVFSVRRFIGARENGGNDGLPSCIGWSSCRSCRRGDVYRRFIQPLFGVHPLYAVD